MDRIDTRRRGPCYRFAPARAPIPTDDEPWLVPVVADGDYYLFVAGDLRFGWLGHPWEGTVCVYGDLLDEIGPKLDGLGWLVVREGGRKPRWWRRPNR